jgi:hypothetical protein
VRRRFYLERFAVSQTAINNYNKEIINLPIVIFIYRFLVIKLTYLINQMHLPRNYTYP